MPQDADLMVQMQHHAQAHLAMVGSGWTPNNEKPHAWRHGGSQPQRVHQLLASQPLAPITMVYEEIFGHILGQKISKAAPNLALAARQLELAEKSGRPLLFVIHREHDNSRGYEQLLERVTSTQLRGVPLRALVQEHVVVVLPLKELPALSHQLGRPPFEAPDRGTPLFVFARSDGEQVGAVTGWQNHERLMNGLAKSLIDYLGSQQTSITNLRRVQRLLGKINGSFVEDVRRLIIRETERKKAERQDKLASVAE
jgi:hypothetical protein